MQRVSLVLADCTYKKGTSRMCKAFWHIEQSGRRILPLYSRTCLSFDAYKVRNLGYDTIRTSRLFQISDKHKISQGKFLWVLNDCSILHQKSRLQHSTRRPTEMAIQLESPVSTTSYHTALSSQMSPSVKSATSDEHLPLQPTYRSVIPLPDVIRTQCHVLIDVGLCESPTFLLHKP